MRLNRFVLASLVGLTAVGIGGLTVQRHFRHPLRAAPRSAAIAARSAPINAVAPPSLAAGPLTVGGSREVLRTSERAVEIESASASAHARPVPVRERFLEKMEAASRGDHTTEAPQSQDGWANWFYGQRAFPGTIPGNAIGKALGQAAANNGGVHGSPGDPTTSGGPPAGPLWAPIGPGSIPDGQTDTSLGPPNPVSGRLSAIAVHPTNPNIVYAGGAQGGVWKTTNALSATPMWTPLTDHQASLAVGSIAIDPVNPNIIYVGTGEPNGSCDSYYGQGILRSTDGGTTWKLFGSEPGGPFLNQTISKVEIDPTTAGSATSTTVWASTATGATSSGTAQCIVAPGAWNGALWRSTDSGASWTLQNVPTGILQPGARVHDMVVDPTDANILYAAVRSVPTAANGGVWKSTNAKSGSPTFTKLAGGFPDAASVNPGYRRITLTIGGTGAHNTLYAALENSFGSFLWGLYKTTDGGTTWSHVDNGVNGTCNVTSGGHTVTRVSGPSFTSSMVGRRIIINDLISRTVATFTDANHVDIQPFENGFPSTLSGVTFSVGSYPTYCDGQCFYDMTLAADPTDATGGTVYAGGNPSSLNTDLSGVPGGHYLWRSEDGGLTWASISEGSGTTGGIHTDDHAIAFDVSMTPARVYDGNDGGIWRSNDQGASWNQMNTNIAITQFQSVSTHPSNPTIVLGGTQDNGTNLANPSKVAPPDWFHSDFGDGGQAVIDQSTPSRMFHTYFNQSFNFMGPAKSTNGGVSGPGSWDFVGAYFGYGSSYYNGMDPTDPVSFYAPLRLNPAFTPNVVYFGSNKLYRSPDPQPTLAKTPSWTVKSPVLTKGGGAFLSAIGVFPHLISGKEVIYTGASDGRVEASATVDGTSSTPTWTTIDAAPLPARFVTDIHVSPSDATGNTVYVSFSGFNVNTPGTPGHLFMTTNGLAPTPTWTNITGDLPDTPANAIAVDPSQTPSILYVGTDIGVFQSLDGGTHWSYLSNGHPVVSVFGLERNARTGQIISSTHGRGMFELVGNGLPDTTPPLCGGSITGPATFTGTALDAGANDTGIASIVLLAGSTNLRIESIDYTSPGSATYTVTTFDHLIPGSGTVRVTDFAGNHCDTAVSIPAGVPAAGLFTIVPCRVTDTRGAGGPSLVAGLDRTYIVIGTCGIPEGTTAIAANVTATQSTAAGDLRVFAGGTPLPTPAVVNYSAGQTRANNAIIQVGVGGTITVHCDQSSGTADFILDVVGYFK